MCANMLRREPTCLLVSACVRTYTCIQTEVASWTRTGAQLACVWCPLCMAATCVCMRRHSYIRTYMNIYSVLLLLVTAFTFLFWWKLHLLTCVDTTRDFATPWQSHAYVHTYLFLPYVHVLPLLVVSSLCSATLGAGVCPCAGGQAPEGEGPAAVLTAPQTYNAGRTGEEGVGGWSG